MKILCGPSTAVGARTMVFFVYLYILYPFLTTTTHDIIIRDKSLYGAEKSEKTRVKKSMPK